MRELTFALLRQCNWACSYCGITCHHRDTTDASVLQAFKTTLQQYSREKHLCINLSGGEPGLLSKSLILDILNSIAEMCSSVHLNIFTNGTAFWIDELLQDNVRTLSPVIKSYRFIWHCTPSIRSLAKIRIPKKLKDRVFPVAVLTEQDIPALDRYLAINRHAYVKPFFAIHNHCYEQDKLGVEDLSKVTRVLEKHYGSFALRSLEIPSFITKSGNPTMATHREFCEKNLPNTHHVYDLSSGSAKRVKCCIALSNQSGTVDCKNCVNHQQFYENALNSYGYTEPLLATN